MSRVKILTDSTADLPQSILDRYSVGVIPLYVLIDGKSYKDGIEITTDELYRLVSEHHSLPQTAAPSVGDFYEAFAPWIRDGYDIIYIGLSSRVSATIQSAVVAADEFEEGRIRIIDSMNLCNGIGLLVWKAAEMVEKGISPEEICKTITGLVPKVRSSFMVDTMKYLYMGGRCSSIQMLAGNVLKIRPQILVKDGGMTVESKYRGKRQSCMDQFFGEFVGDGSRIAGKRIFVANSGSPEEELIAYRDRLHQMGIGEVCIAKAGTVISSHCGPGTFGLFYIEK